MMTHTKIAPAAPIELDDEDLDFAGGALRTASDGVANFFHSTGNEQILPMNGDDDFMSMDSDEHFMSMNNDDT